MRFINAMLTLVLAISLFSCGTAGEEFFLDADGRGRVVAETDLSSMWGFMQMGLQQELNKEENNDPAKQEFFNLFLAENIDTTFSFIDFVSNIAESQGSGPIGLMDVMEQMESEDMTDEQREVIMPLMSALGSTDMRLMGNSATNKYGLNTIQYFDNVDDIISLGESFSKASSMVGEETGAEVEEMEVVSGMMGTATSYRLEGNTLYVSRPAQEESEDMDPQMAMAMAMFSGDSGDFTMTLHLPGKIKKVSREAEIDKRAGLVTVTMPAAEAEAGFEFSVKFKPARRR